MSIPKIIHHIWVGSPLPNHLAECVRTWRDLHPGWKHRMWNNTNLGWLANRDLYDNASKLVPRDAVEQFQADVARYEILRRFGGLYVDCDTRALRSVDDALVGHDAWAASEDGRWIGNTYLAAVPNHAVFNDLVSGIPMNVKRHPGRRPNVLTGPKYLTPIWRKHKCHVAERRLWYPYSYSNVKANTVPSDVGGAYAEHLWDHTRTAMERRKR